MSARRPTSTPQNEHLAPVIADLLDVELDDYEREDSQLYKVLSDLGAGEGFVTVTRYDAASPNSSGWASCCRVPLGEFDPFQVSATYGPGKYRFRICRPNGQVVTNITREFAEQRRPLVGSFHGAPPAPAAAGAALPARGDDRLELLERRLEAERARHQDFMQTLVTGLLTRDSGGSTDLKAMLEAFREGRESRAETAPAHEMVMDAIKLGLDLKQSAADSGESGGSVLERMAPRVMGILEKALGAGRSAPGAESAAPLVLPPGGTTAPNPNGDPLKGLVAHYAPYLIQEAAAGHDPELWAEWLLERTPPAWKPALLRLAYAEPMPRHALMAEIHSGLVPYFPWIDRACEALVSLTSEDEDEDGEETVASEPAASVESPEPTSG